MPAKNDYDLGEPYKIRLEPDSESKIHAIMELTGESKPDTIRRLLRIAIELELADHSLGFVLPQIRRAVSESLKPFENRIAALTAKATIASATSMYTNLEYLGQSGKRDIKAVHEEARKRAVSYTRTPTDLKDE